MQYAVIRSGGKQYKVSKDSIIEVDKVLGEENKSLSIDDVLLVVDDNGVVVGKPTVSGAKITAKIVQQKKGDKIRVMKYKSKVRYRRTMGFRPMLSLLEIQKIDYSGKKNEVQPKPASKTSKK